MNNIFQIIIIICSVSLYKYVCKELNVISLILLCYIKKCLASSLSWLVFVAVAVFAVAVAFAMARVIVS